MTHLVWFRNDLRIADNPALTAACQSGEPVEACFLLADAQWQAHDVAPAKRAFLGANLRELQAALADLGIPMHWVEAPLFSDAPAAILALSAQRGVHTVHCNEEYAVNERRRDRAVHEHLKSHAIRLLRYRDQTLAPVGQILTAQQQPYLVYTPFYRRWREYLEQHPPLLHPIPQRRDHTGLTLAPLRPLVSNEHVPPPLVTAGENAAHRQLVQFLEQRAGDYKRQRDIPAVDGTSRLSPYLALGVLSGRQCLHAAWAALAATPGDTSGLEGWINELGWRDFYIHILYHFPRVSMHRAFKPETEHLPWRTDAAQLQAWQAGQTGIPIVDAAMRQLTQTGWMHNRLRMICAMFLSKNLFLDWRLGERFFMRHLVDGHLAANNGGWQWNASTGTDAAPYFRIFNPVAQSEKFDPEGAFIRRFVPELAHLDNRRLHDPSGRGGRPIRYPAAIVDLKTSRQAAIEHFKALAQRPGADSVP
ncbi:MAG: deoxyribodipyrimidine photo-lyase [Gammaproteobacteria bacterium]|nr:deoxyribodipyrimidine photo-lyase [Gammaproteobacteria bacterium]